MYYNYKRSTPYVDMDDKPLYAFGYGLSYSEFAFDNITVETVSLAQIQAGGEIVLSLDVTNLSNRAGKAVPQLYIYRCGGTVTHRLKELKGFEKVALAPKETKRVTFCLGFDDLKEWSIARKYELHPCTLTLMVARASDDVVWKTEVEVK